LERRTEEILIALDTLDFSEQVKVLRTVIEKIYKGYEVEHINATHQALQAESRMNILKDLEDDAKT
jgi:hypothetical protein